MRKLPTLTLKVPVDSGDHFGHSSSTAVMNASFRSETPIVPHHLPYLSANTTQSMIIAVQHDASPSLHQTPSSTSTTTSQFFSKLKGGISRSRSPSSMRSASALSAHPMQWAEPRSPTFGNVSASSYDRPQSHWSDDSSPSSRMGALLKKSLTTVQASAGITAETISRGLTSRPRGASSGLPEEFDPTTFRRNRTRPPKNPDDVYFGYDDLFDDSLDEYNGTEIMGKDALGNMTNTENMLTPPSSLPSPGTSQRGAAGSHETAVPPPVVRPNWNTHGSSNYVTPPQSKPPSVTELLAPTYTMPPTPPPPTRTAVMHGSPISFLPPQDEPTFFSPGPPPGHALPPVPPSRGPSKSKKGSVRRGDNSSRRSKNAEGLGIINILPSTNFVSNSTLQHDASSVTHTVTGPLDVARDPLYCNNNNNCGQQTNLNTASSRNAVHRIPRKEVGSAQRPKSIMGQIADHDARATSLPTGFTPQMRIIDVRDMDEEFACTSFDDTPVASPNIDTMKEVVLDAGSDLGNSNTLDTMKEVISEQAQPVEETNKERDVEVSNDTNKKADTTHLRVFRQFLKKSGPNDAFIHRFPRFDALQTQRICGPRNDSVADPSRGLKKPPSEDVSTKTSKMRQQREVNDQMSPGVWALMAHRWMNYGRIVFSPAQDVLATVPAKKGSRTMIDGKIDGKGEVERRRVLDLGGAPIGDWGWHCAYDYPRSKVYTVTTRSAKTSHFPTLEPEDSSPSQLSKMKGPKNHRHLVVSYLWRLPFPENHFDVVSARSLYTTLKVHRHASRSMSITELQSPLNIMDEYDLCLEECLRVLKPGGYLEFTLLDNDLMNPGPLGQELSTKFTGELLANAYDPNPTRKWIQRLNKAGYGEIKRAWIFYPMAPQIKPTPPAKEDEYHVHHQRTASFDDITSVKEEVRRKMEAWEDLGVKKGSVELVAPITGLLGGSIWEHWMLKMSSETEGTSDWRPSIDTIAKVLEEGRDMESGWRTLIGWARKPLVTDTYSFGMRMREDSTASTYSTR